MASFLHATECSFGAAERQLASLYGHRVHPPGRPDRLRHPQTPSRGGRLQAPTSAPRHALATGLKHPVLYWYDAAGSSYELEEPRGGAHRTRGVGLSGVDAPGAFVGELDAFGNLRRVAASTRDGT